jgi:hypothetical protein
VSIFCLTVHAAYACGRSGACCTAGWSIPVEPHLRVLLGSERLVPDATGSCRFFDRDAHTCRVHRDHGPNQLPVSCHHFPRRALIDARGTFVALSHFCPTAARLLVDSPRPLAIVTEPAAFPASRGYDGLDARDEWPPLVRPNLLFDHDSYSRWEQFLVTTLAADGPVERALGTIASAAEAVRAWTPEPDAFAPWLERTLAQLHTPDESALRIYDDVRNGEPYARVCATVPAGVTAPAPVAGLRDVMDAAVLPHWDRFSEPVRRYVATKAFASWTAYQGRGVRTLVAELIVSEIVLRTEAAHACLTAGRALDRDLLINAIRASDHLLMHLVDRTALMTWLGMVERLRTGNNGAIQRFATPHGRPETVRGARGTTTSAACHASSARWPTAETGPCRSGR